ncbi:unnamed protein product [Dicrocoelium dendriticum]|nr:unnamed protein product [Dicrocoelium dendriticum]
MHDDKGRLILIINSATQRDAGHYRCHGYDGVVDAFLVITQEHLTDDDSGPVVITQGSVIRKQIMFSSDRLDKVILKCPVSGNQVVKSWLWREPILPNSEDFSKLPQGKPPSRTVTAKHPGRHESGHVEIGPQLAWARVLDPLSPESPVLLWCQFELPSVWENKDPIAAHYAIEWELYEPIAPKVLLLTTDDMLTDDAPGMWMSNKSTAEVTHTDLTALLQQIESAEMMRSAANQQPLTVLEHKPAKFACRFRVVDRDGPKELDAQKLPMQQVYWYRDGQSVHVPPFYVDNSLTNSHGISVLEVRAYSSLFQPHRQVTEDMPTGGPIEQITCSVTSQLKSNPVYKINTNDTLDVVVIIIPQIINKSLLSTERSVEDAVKLTCVAIANGPPEMVFEFGRTQWRTDAPEWIPIEPRYGLNTRRIAPDRENPTLHRLVLDISDLRPSDHGPYRCSVWNKAGRAQAIGHVLVRSRPQLEIVPSESSYFVGHKPWIASCHVTGYPLSKAKQMVSGARSVEFDKSSGEDPVAETTVTSHDETTPNPTDTGPVRMAVFTPDGEPMEKAEVNLLSYETNAFLGINATFQLQLSQRLGSEAMVRCEYTHLDGQVFQREMSLKEATKPPAPNITVLCAGPSAVVFGVSNPRAGPQSSPTERIVTQKVIFAPAKSFHHSTDLETRLVYLDSEGQPSASPSNASLENQHVTVNAAHEARPHTAIIPVKGLASDTEYVFEWSSGNEFGLSVMVQFALWTTRLETPPPIKNVISLKPSPEFLRFSIFLGDPCPYSDGARAQLSDLLVRYRPTRVNESDPYGNQLVGYGEWSEMRVCRRLHDESYSKEHDDELSGDDQPGIRWSGDKPLPCDLPVSDTQAAYEVQFATQNRFEKSDWFTTIYRPKEAVHSSALCYPTCGVLKTKASRITIYVLVGFVCPEFWKAVLRRLIGFTYFLH